MNLDEILALYDREVRIEMDEPGHQREVLPRVVRLVRAEPPLGFIRYSRLDERNVEDEIRAQMDYFTGLDMTFEWDVLDHDQPGDLIDRLLAHGFTPELDEDDPGALLVLDVQEAPAELQAPAQAEVRQLRDPGELQVVVETEAAVWGGDFSWLQPRLAAHLAIPGYLAVFAAYVQDAPVSCAWIYYFPGTQFAVLRGGSTLPNYRRQGLYSALLAARVQDARQRGYRFVIVDAAPTSRPILEKHGFRLLTHAQSFKWRAEA